MTGFIQKFCKDNPIYKIPCGDCKEEIKVKSIELFSEDNYKLTCPKCGSVTNCNTTKFEESIKKQFKSLGIICK